MANRWSITKINEISLYFFLLYGVSILMVNFHHLWQHGVSQAGQYQTSSKWPLLSFRARIELLSLHLQWEPIVTRIQALVPIVATPVLYYSTILLSRPYFWFNVGVIYLRLCNLPAFVGITRAGESRPWQLLSIQTIGTYLGVILQQSVGWNYDFTYTGNDTAGKSPNKKHWETVAPECKMEMRYISHDLACHGVVR